MDPAEELQDTPANAVPRRPNGTCAPGNKGSGSANAGAKRPYRTIRQMADVRASDQLWRSLMLAVKNGESWACKMLTEYAEGKPVETIDVTARGGLLDPELLAALIMVEDEAELAEEDGQ